MKEIRVFKIKIKSSILRQLVFTNTNILIGFCLTLNLIAIYLFRELSNETKLLVCAILTTTVIIVATIKIDNRTIPALLPKIALYLLNNKNVRV